MSAELAPLSGPPAPSWVRPTRISEAAYLAKVAALRARRVAHDLAGGPAMLLRGDGEGLDQVVGESCTPLMSDVGPEERDFQLGKIQNLRRACRALDGLLIPTGAVFSFWRQVGPPSPARGFVAGRMLQEGCMVAAPGGGLCQLSNALYDVVLQAGCTIIERHAHSRIVPGSAAARGRDATVAWNYVDLRFAPDRDLRLTARLESENLRVQLSAAVGGEVAVAAAAPRIDSPVARQGLAGAPRSCASCNEADCHLHRRERRRPTAQVAARVFLVDEAWPEIRAYVRAAARPGDSLGRPIDVGRLGAARHDWSRDGFERAASAPLAALRRSLAVRGAGGAGGALRRAELESAEAVAAGLARLLTYDVEAVTVAQSYLPYLWRDGLLGGREIAVLMTRLPMGVIQSRLDAAAARHPDRPSLADFRAAPWLAQAEAEALAACARIITPHAEIAALFAGRAERLAWETPPRRRRAADQPLLTGRIAFAGPTAARKGAYAVREAAMALGLEVAPLGAELEGPDFWRGVRVARPADGLEIDAIVQPALVEHAPRRLLAAMAAGVPVIASPACGLDPQPGLTLVPPDDAAALIAALRALGLSSPSPAA